MKYERVFVVPALYELPSMESTHWKGVSAVRTSRKTAGLPRSRASLGN